MWWEKTEQDNHLYAKKRDLDHSLTVFRRITACQQLDFELGASRILRQYISVVEATQSVVLCYGNTNKWIQNEREKNWPPCRWKWKRTESGNSRTYIIETDNFYSSPNNKTDKTDKYFEQPIKTQPWGKDHSKSLDTHPLINHPSKLKQFWLIPSAGQNA